MLEVECAGGTLEVFDTNRGDGSLVMIVFELT